MREAAARVRDEPFGLPYVNRRRRPFGELQFGKRMRRFPCLQDLPYHGQGLVVGQKRQITLRHRRDEADLRCLARAGRPQVVRQRGLLQAVDAAEQVNLVAGQAHAVGGNVLCERRALLALGHSHVHGRPLLRPLDAEPGLGTANVEGGGAQIAVILQRDADELAQFRFDEGLFPAHGRDGEAVRSHHLASWVRGGQRRRRPLVPRDQ